MPLAKTPNAAWKDYLKNEHGTLGFTDWLHREKEKMFYSNGDTTSNLLLVNKPLNDSIQTAIQSTLAQGGLKDQESGKTVFGINKWALIGGGFVLAAIITYVIVINVKKVKS